MLLLKIKKQFLLNYLKLQQHILNLTNKIFILNKIKDKKYLRLLFIKILIQKNKLIRQYYCFKYFNKNFNSTTTNLRLNFNKNFKLDFKKKKKQNLITYIINIYLTNTNTFINITDLKGNSKVYYSSGYLNLKGKQKIKQPLTIINILKILITKTKFLKNKPIAIHFKNIKSYYESLITKKIKNKFFIKFIRSYNLQSHNGCKLKKIKRFKKK